MKTLQTNLVTLPLKKLIFLLILNGNSSFALVKMVIGHGHCGVYAMYCSVHYIQLYTMQQVDSVHNEPGVRAAG